MNKSAEEKLIDAGGNLWEKGEMRRIYLNEWLELAGVNITRYNTGNISSASINGEKLSNAKASELASVKCYWDCTKAKIVFQGRARALDDVAPMLREKISQIIGE